MVRATRARCYESDTGESEDYDSRASKRRRISPLPRCADKRSPPSAHERHRSMQKQAEAPTPSAVLSRSGKDGVTEAEVGEEVQHYNNAAEQADGGYAQAQADNVELARKRVGIEDTDPGTDAPEKGKRRGSESDCSSHHQQGVGTVPPTLGAAITPPTSPLTPPTSVRPSPEPFNADSDAPDFTRQLDIAYIKSTQREAARKCKYGAAISTAWKRGFTPEEARDAWNCVKARREAEVDEVSDSD